MTSIVSEGLLVFLMRLSSFPDMAPFYLTNKYNFHFMNELYSGKVAEDSLVSRQEGTGGAPGTGVRVPDELFRARFISFHHL